MDCNTCCSVAATHYGGSRAADVGDTNAPFCNGKTLLMSADSLGTATHLISVFMLTASQ